MHSMHDFEEQVSHAQVPKVLIFKGAVLIS